MAIILNGTTGITDVNGTAAAPAITGTDTDTGIFFPAANTLAFSTNGTEDARFDSAGNFGLGVTPSANWTSAGSQKAMQVGNYGALSSSGTGVGGYYQTVLGMNCVDHTTSTKYLNTGVATAYVQATGQHQWLNAVSGTAGNAITFTQAMTLDASGNLGVGTTSPSYRLDISAASSNNAVTAVRAGSGYTSYVAIAGNGTTPLSSSFDLIQDGTNAYIYQRANAPIVFGTNNTERARIDSSGNLLVGATAQLNTEKQYIYQSANGIGLQINCVNASYTDYLFRVRAARNTTNGTFNAIGYYNDGAGAYKFNVADSGNVTNTNNSYGAISDVKFKENITDATPKLAQLNQVRVVNYNFIGDTNKQLGVIAQELEQIFPAMVEETTDRDAEGNDLGTTSKSVKYSVFVPMLIKAIQEQQAIITQLQADVAALKGTQP